MIAKAATLISSSGSRIATTIANVGTKIAPAVTKGASKLETAIPEARVQNVENAVQKVHGNSLASQAPTWGYKLYLTEGKVFLKNGITSNLEAETRYSRAYMETRKMETILFNNRLDAHNWEYEQKLIGRGPLNLNMR